MMQQYLKLKAEDPDVFVVFIAWGFYELFYDDAAASVGIFGIFL